MSRLVALPQAGFEALAALHAQAFERPWSAAEIETLAAAPGALGLAAEDDGALFGFVLIRAVAGEAEVLTLAVDPAQRRQGLGRALMQAASSAAAGAGAEEIFLEVAEDNLAALALYTGAGFAPVGRRPAYYPRKTGAVDAILLRARLNSGPPVG